MIGQIKIAQQGIGLVDQAHRPVRERGEYTQSLHHSPGLRSLNRKQTVMRCGVDDLHVIGHNEFFEALGHLVRQTRLKIQAAPLPPQ